MTPTRKRRLIAALAILIGISIAGSITVYSLRQNMLFFISPSDVMAEALPVGRQFRLGGLVLPGSVKRGDDGLAVEFDVSDGAETITVSYNGILPDLFKEGQGVITRGVLTESGTFDATEVLAKHDENYMPPEVADALEKTGHTVSKDQ
jgi:cytochrome c-type biogenesis protein CcmE